MNTDPMQDFYDHFPYPLTEARPNSSVNGANMFRILDRESRTNGFAGLTFLDIGCGSGHRILDIAKTFPNARFVGFDISGKNIELAKDQAKLDQVTNITFTQCGIDDYERTVEIRRHHRERCLASSGRSRAKSSKDRSVSQE